MKTFKEFFNIQETDLSVKNELVCRNIARIMGNIGQDKYIRKVEAQGQRDNASLMVYMQNGDVFELVPRFIHNLLGR